MLSHVKIRIDQNVCQGHGRCYDLAPTLVEPDDIGNGREIGDGTVPADLEQTARKAAANCPEQAVILEESA
jgi:ferredoxin